MQTPSKHSYRLNVSKIAWSVAGCIVGMATIASAAPLGQVEILGSLTDNGTDWSPTIAATPGQTVYFELTDVLAPAGTSNSTNGYTTVAQVAGTDGLGSFGSLAITDSSDASLTGSLTTEWQQGLGSTQGSQTGDPITFNSLLATGAAYVGTTTPNVLATGSFVAGADGDVLSATTGNFNMKVDTTTGQKNLVAKANTGTDPYIGFSNLTVTTGSNNVPEPTSIALLGFAGSFLVRRRSRA